jgi:hypothetical protein
VRDNVGLHRRRRGFPCGYAAAGCLSQRGAERPTALAHPAAAPRAISPRPELLGRGPHQLSLRRRASGDRAAGQRSVDHGCRPRHQRRDRGPNLADVWQDDRHTRIREPSPGRAGRPASWVPGEPAARVTREPVLVTMMTVSPARLARCQRTSSQVMTIEAPCPSLGCKRLGRPHRRSRTDQLNRERRCRAAAARR